MTTRRTAISAKRKRDVEANLQAATALSQKPARFQRTSVFNEAMRVAASLSVLEREV